MQQQDENSNEPTSGPSCHSDPSNIKFHDILKTYHNDLLTAYYTRIGFKNYSRFSLTDFHFSVNFNFHEDYENIYLLTTLNEVLEAFTAMLREIKEQFDGDLDRIIYIILTLFEARVGQFVPHHHTLVCSFHRIRARLI